MQPCSPLHTTRVRKRAAVSPSSMHPHCPGDSASCGAQPGSQGTPPWLAVLQHKNVYTARAPASHPSRFQEGALPATPATMLSGNKPHDWPDCSTTETPCTQLGRLQATQLVLGGSFACHAGAHTIWEQATCYATISCASRVSLGAPC